MNGKGMILALLLLGALMATSVSATNPCPFQKRSLGPDAKPGEADAACALCCKTFGYVFHWFLYDTCQCTLRSWGKSPIEKFFEMDF